MKKELVQPELTVENGLILLTRSYNLLLAISDLKIKKLLTRGSIYIEQLRGPAPKKRPMISG